MQFFQLIQKPAYQGLLFIILTVVATFTVKPRNVDNLWVICGLAYCFFILTNSILSFFVIDTWRYFFISLGFSFLYLLAITVITTILTKALKLEGSGESAMMFLVIILHPVLLLLSVFLKWVF